MAKKYEDGDLISRYFSYHILLFFLFFTYHTEFASCHFQKTDCMAKYMYIK